MDERWKQCIIIPACSLILASVAVFFSLLEDAINHETYEYLFPHMNK